MLTQLTRSSRHRAFPRSIRDSATGPQPRYRKAAQNTDREAVATPGDSIILDFFVLLPTSCLDSQHALTFLFPPWRHLWVARGRLHTFVTLVLSFRLGHRFDPPGHQQGQGSQCPFAQPALSISPYPRPSTWQLDGRLICCRKWSTRW